MIALREMTGEERLSIEDSFPEQHLDTLRDTFTTLKFKSMISEKAWGKYSSPFKELKDGRKYFT